jgi:hypothetical protein
MVQLCIVIADFGLPHWTQYNEENCLIYFNATKPDGDTIPNLELLQFEYQIGVFLGYVEDKANATVHLDLIGDACDSQTEYYAGAPTCIGAISLNDVNDTWTAHFEPHETKFYTYRTGVVLSHLTFSMMGAAEESISVDESFVHARYGGGSFTISDFGEANGTLSITSPRQGLWVFAVHSASGGNADFKITEFACGDKSAGPNCMIPVKEPFSNTTITITPEDGWMYLRFVVTEKLPLLVSITTNNGSNIPYMYASRGQIPTHNGAMVLADIHNCNREYCDVVRSIVRNITLPAGVKGVSAVADEYWYIGIYTNIPGNTTFALWWNQTCVPECDTDNHGECLDSGRCLCEIDFEGIDCSVSKGLGPQYIVLIIIASLVVASAIIGFVAWAYMRRKRNNYEIVS